MHKSHCFRIHYVRAVPASSARRHISRLYGLFPLYDSKVHATRSNIPLYKLKIGSRTNNHNHKHLCMAGHDGHFSHTLSLSSSKESELVKRSFSGALNTWGLPIHTCTCPYLYLWACGSKNKSKEERYRRWGREQSFHQWCSHQHQYTSSLKQPSRDVMDDL